MSGRNLDPALASALSNSIIMPAVLAMLTFKSATKFVWSGVGPLTWGGNTFVGGGGFVGMGPISESTEVEARGMTVALGGIPSDLLTECLSDIQLGLPAKIWFALLDNGSIIGAPYLHFSGTVDKPAITIDVETSTISLALENKLSNLQRASQHRYTAADQQIQFPTDTSMNYVEILNDVALKYGQS